MHRVLTVLLLAFLAFDSTRAAAWAQQIPLLPDQIEEDWQLVIGTPDTVGAGPQITTSMSPTTDIKQPFVAFDMNYREYPSFNVGGMQVQVWSAKKLLDTSTQGSGQFSTSGETVTWTQRMSLLNGTATYTVVNGQSTTWGKFGQGNGLLAVNFTTSATSLAGYDPAFSVKNSGATWESNLVSSMKLVQVRYYSGGQLIATDNTPRPVTLPD